MGEGIWLDGFLGLQPTMERSRPLEVRPKHAQPLCSFPSDLIYVVDQVSCVLRVIPQITSCIDPLDWLAKELYWLGLLDAPRGPDEKHCSHLRDAEGDPPVP